MTFAPPARDRSWQRAWRGLADGAAVQRALLAAWAEPQRRYHTLQHLDECIVLFEGVADAAAQPQAVELALWFHDAVYDPAAHDNEANSAAWARRALQGGGAAAALVEDVAALVLATAHSGAQPASADAALLLDIDLAILGAPPPRFAAYESQIRAEYAFVPDAVFRTRRRAVLQAFAARPRIFHTARFQRSHEAQARANLARALA